MKDKEEGEEVGRHSLHTEADLTLVNEEWEGRVGRASGHSTVLQPGHRRVPE